MGALRVTVEHRRLGRQCSETVTLLIAVSYVWLYTRGGQTCFMYEPHIVKPNFQRAAT